MPPKPGECTPGAMSAITDDKKRSQFISECNKVNAQNRPSAFARAEQQAEEQRRNPIPAATAPPAAATGGHAPSVADPVANLFGGGLENAVRALRKPGGGGMAP